MEGLGGAALNLQNVHMNERTEVLAESWQCFAKQCCVNLGVCKCSTAPPQTMDGFQGTTARPHLQNMDEEDHHMSFLAWLLGILVVGRIVAGVLMRMVPPFAKYERKYDSENRWASSR